MILILIVGIAVLLICKTGSQQFMIARNRAILRSGSGSVYPKLIELPVSSIIDVFEPQPPWYKASYEGMEGYIVQTATCYQETRQDVFFGLLQALSPQFKADNIDQRVRAFADYFNLRFSGDNTFVDGALGYRLDPQAYEIFKADTYAQQNREHFWRAYPLPTRSSQDFFNEAHEGFGLALASVIAALGIYKNPQLQDYINKVGSLIVASSDVPDSYFRFFVLDLPEANAYACPGGIVFITRGMFEHLESEADLAFILAHEIAHVSHFHGFKELLSAQDQLDSSSSTPELDFFLGNRVTVDQRYSIEEMEAIVMDIYSNLVSGRLDGYEEEADFIGLLYTARCGYSTAGVLDLLNRINRAELDSNSHHYRKQSTHYRKIWLRQFNNRYLSGNQSALHFMGRFPKHKSTLG